MRNFFIVIIFFCFVGCTTTQRAVLHSELTEHTTTKVDSVYITKLMRDSIYLHDSVFVKIKGDSVMIERWHTKYVSKISHDTIWAEKLFYDTIYTSKVDSVSMEKQLSKWQQFKMDIADGLMVIVGLFILGLGAWIFIKSRKQI